jgi:hypothetical protein
MLPHYIGSEKISNFVRRSGISKKEFDKYRARHLEHLQAHEDPLNLPEENGDDDQSKKLGGAIVRGMTSLTKTKT